MPKQPQYEPLPIEKQIVVIYAAVNGFCDREQEITIYLIMERDGVFLAFGVAGLPLGGPRDGLLAQW